VGEEASNDALPTDGLSGIAQFPKIGRVIPATEVGVERWVNSIDRSTAAEMLRRVSGWSC
jgi:hypothetical protein